MAAMTTSSMPWRCILAIGSAGLLLISVAGCADEAAPKVASVSPATTAGETAASSTSGEMSVEDYVAKHREFVECARENGAPDMPDPDEFGAIKLLSIPEGPTGLKLMKECSPLIEGLAMPEELQRRLREKQAGRMTEAQKQAERDFANCMQENGVPDWPDPDANGLPVYPDWAQPGSTLPRPPEVDPANEICQPILGGGPEAGQPDVRGSE
ncbi:hypothetical protein [Nocardioides sp.]|uniref:hypothetical protein n=1 Tax=Nocardioides sp. TaxID=35761 RepID=UPI002C9F3CA1|nr:hypothetical protein [Nocardioides sp.]HSX67113.1 hypothetical protein [Nocardioides sp.]